MLGLSVTLGALHFGGYGLMTVAATAAACWLASTAAAIKKHAYYYPATRTHILVSASCHGYFQFELHLFFNCHVSILLIQIQQRSGSRIKIISAYSGISYLLLYI